MLDLQKTYREIVEEFNIYHFFRLVIIICGYIFLRQRVSAELKRRQLKKQIDDDKKAREDDLIDRPEDFEEVTGVEASDKAWGWGKSTRRKVRSQQKIFEEEIEKAALRSQNNFDDDSDDDIKDLLED
ncbi:unnamed protein product [[Candida] boidinii]|uniref:Unnamed protein product n=1 Tax=Candida boidinii TaxID=5477 RepID=A0A9W6WBF5_CANBO|nr:hypothetical protein B5S30_g4319 [[Candida] boidinii]GME74416.1 unnamed protein product [[Candida] boidinii]GMF71100.1 unnamed protein product [[Candida] boidinii]GMG00033.1 unnamed protein product [[Candida] boidinii]